MVFASLVFLYFFLPLNIILYYISKNAIYRNILLTLFSFIFYAWGEPVWIVLLFFTAFLDFGNALFISKFKNTKWANLGVVSSVVLNILVLMVFKYSGFLVENFNFLFGANLPVPGFSLPIGISFYTFQSLSYVIDVYRGDVTVQKEPYKFLMFVSLYPQLVAGPIVRYAHVAHEIDNRKVDIRDISAGISRFCIGLFKKVCIANVAGEMVVRYMNGDLNSLSVGESWLGIIMFTIQIYFDFSGYSDMAIGLGRMFGFHFHENFRYPYISKSATEFWRRWHISLATFIKDYVYIPLGGNKKRPYLNLFIIWFLTGMWHGASWNFILWGLYFGLLIAFERLLLKRIFEAIPKIFSHIYLIIAVIFGWVLFYFVDFNRMWHYLRIMTFNTCNKLWDFSLNLTLQENMFWFVIAILLCLPVYITINRYFKNLVMRKNHLYLFKVSMFFHFILLLISTVMIVANGYNPFIYYRF